MEALFGSVKKAFSSVGKAAKKVVTNIGKTATSTAKNIGNAVIKGASQFKASMSNMVKTVMPKIKEGVVSLIKGVTKNVGFFYRLWGENIEYIDNRLLMLMPGGVIIKGLNTIGATDIHPTKNIPKLLARLFYKSIDALPGDSEDKLYKTVLFGFKYDYEQDITYTIPEAPQRMAGYTPTYDLASRDIGFNIAAQIITFTYGGKVIIGELQVAK